MARVQKFAEEPTQKSVIPGKPVGAWLEEKADVALNNNKAEGLNWKGTQRPDIFEGSDKDDIVFAGKGDDILITGGGADLVSAGGGNDFVLAEAGNDVVLGDQGFDTIFGQAGNDVLFGGADVDTINGGEGTDILIGGQGADVLSGGAGADRFVYNADSFTGAVFTPAANGINTSSLPPDAITDFTIAEDQITLVAADLGLSPNVVFQNGNSGTIAADGNVIVLTNPFANAAAAAKAIADNNAIQADAGIFVYFNANLGFSRVVHSKDLSDGGDISVLANLTNQTGQNGITALANFTANNFTVV